jgi:hypothetical protein
MRLSGSRRGCGNRVFPAFFCILFTKTRAIAATLRKGCAQALRTAAARAAISIFL